MISGRRSVTGSAVAIGLVVALTAVLAPFRHHLSAATPGLVLVIPVVVGNNRGRPVRRPRRGGCRIGRLRPLLHPALRDPYGREVPSPG